MIYMNKENDPDTLQVMDEANQPWVEAWDKLNTELECPCRPDVTTEECEDCQDLPRGYFKHRREEDKMRENLAKI
jgi:hypothetical protein